MNRTNTERTTTVDSNVKSRSIIALLLTIILLMSIFIYFEHQKSELAEQEAYLLSALITLQEDNLFLAYGLLPKDIGLQELKDAWTDSPCYETATKYSNALRTVLEKLEESSLPPASQVDKNFV